MVPSADARMHPAMMQQQFQFAQMQQMMEWGMKLMQSQAHGRGAALEGLISYDTPRRRRPELVDSSASIAVPPLQRDLARSQSQSALQIVPLEIAVSDDSEVRPSPPHGSPPPSEMVALSYPRGPSPPRQEPTTPGGDGGAKIKNHVSQVLEMMSSRKTGKGKKRQAPAPESTSDDDSDEPRVDAAAPLAHDGAGDEATATAAIPLPVAVIKKKPGSKANGKDGTKAKAGKGGDAATAAAAKGLKNDKKGKKAKKAGTAAGAATATATEATHGQGDKGGKIPYKDLIAWDGSYATKTLGAFTSRAYDTVMKRGIAQGKDKEEVRPFARKAYHKAAAVYAKHMT